MRRKPKIQNVKKKRIVIQRSGKKSLKARFLSWASEYKAYVGAGFVLAVVAAFLFAFSGRNGPHPEAGQLTVSQAVDSIPVPDPEEVLFPYPDLIRSIPGLNGADYTKEVIERDIGLQAFFQTKGLSEKESKDIAFQARFVDLDTFETSHILFELGDRGPIRERNRLFIYEIAFDTFAVIQLRPSIKVELLQLPVQTRPGLVSGIVEDTFFWASYLENGGDYALIPDITHALKYKVDLYHVSPNDRYQFVYEQKWYKGQVIGVGDLMAAYFRKRGEDIYVFRFEESDGFEFFDEEGHPAISMFLQSPVEYNIINSPYNPRRIHPVLDVEMPHYGTDYYATLDDPVFAVAAGEVEIAGSTSNNGNYVKIRHNETYQTQYLHLNGFANGIHSGSKVEQGQVIGYAGKTGLATGVHVCFRFWVDGVQADHTREPVYQASNNLKRVDDLYAFLKFRDRMKSLMMNNPIL